MLDHILQDIVIKSTDGRMIIVILNVIIKKEFITDLFKKNIRTSLRTVRA